MRPKRPPTKEELVLFEEERASFKLVYRCQDCVHVNGADLSCSFGYPNFELVHSDSFLASDGRYVFCKYFEMD